MNNSPYLDRPLLAARRHAASIAGKGWGGPHYGRASRGAAPPPTCAVDPRSAHAAGAFVDPVVT